MKKFTILVLIFFLATFSAFSMEKLKFNDFIADNAQVISDTSEVELNALLYDLQQKTKADIAVVTLKSLENRPIEDVALKIGREYKIGDKKLNNGAVVLVVPNDREARIEIGYGLEGAISDSHAGRILDDYMIPYFKEDNYEKGIIDGTTALAVDVANSYGAEVSVSKPAKPTSASSSDFPNFWGFLALVFLILLVNLIVFLAQSAGLIVQIVKKYKECKEDPQKLPELEALINALFATIQTSSSSNNSSISSSSSSFSNSRSSSFGGGGGFGGGGSSRKW